MAPPRPRDRVATPPRSSPRNIHVAARGVAATRPFGRSTWQPAAAPRPALRTIHVAAAISGGTSGPKNRNPDRAGAAGLVICTGTTAFPTKAWSETGRDGVAAPVLKALVDAGFDKTAAIADLTAQGYNTPQTVDEAGTLRILEAWAAAAGAARERLVLLSSVGVRRRGEMPYPILNACGVLDAKAAAEDAIAADAAAGGYAYTIVRPSQLFGGPYDNNVYLGTLFQLDKDADTREVLLGRGDVTMNDDPQLGTLRSTLAEVIAQTLETGACENLDFTVVNGKGEFPEADVLRARLAALG